MEIHSCFFPIIIYSYFIYFFRFTTNRLCIIYTEIIYTRGRRNFIKAINMAVAGAAAAVHATPTLLYTTLNVPVYV
jgi:hypothetical protein